MPAEGVKDAEECNEQPSGASIQNSESGIAIGNFPTLTGLPLHLGVLERTLNNGSPSCRSNSPDNDSVLDPSSEWNGLHCVWVLLALTVCSLVSRHLQGPINDATSQRRHHTAVESDYPLAFIHHLDALSVGLIAHQVVLRLHLRLDCVEGVPNEAVRRPKEESGN